MGAAAPPREPGAVAKGCWVLEPLRVALLAASASLAAAGPGLYAWIVRSSGGAGELWRRLRVLLYSSVAGFAAAAAGVGWIDAETLAAAVLVLLGLYAAVHFVLEYKSRVMLVGLAGRTVEVRVLRSRTPTAFSFAATGRIYISEGLLSALPADRVLAIIAHEMGHRESLRPLHPGVVNTLFALAALATGLGAGLQPGWWATASAAAIGSEWVLWVVYNWAWESLADLYSVAAVGAPAVAALAEITGERPRPPGLGEAYRWLASVMRPRRAPGGLFLLVNPHPPASARLYVMQKALWEAPGLAWAAA